MSEKFEIDLGNVQKTLLLPLWGRAYETKKDHPLLVDKTAVEIIGKIDYDFAALAAHMNKLTQMAWIMRSIIVDRVIAQFLEKYPQATIVNIGCGLDTTFDRMDNGRLSWYELDLADVIRLRKKFIPESSRRKFLSTSFLEEGWLTEIVVKENVLFISAGVFYYFTEEEIKGFLTRLADRFPGSETLFDVCSPVGMRTANRMVVKSAGLDERSYLKWGLKKTEDILSWDERFKLLGTIYYYKDKRISLKLRMAGLISDLLKIQYMLHLRLGNVI